MKKQILSLCLLVVLVFSVVPVGAAEGHQVTYAPDEYEIPFSAIETLENAVQTEQGIELTAGGTVVFGLLLPFNVSAVTVKTADTAAPLQLRIDGKVYTLVGNETYTFDHIIRKKGMQIEVAAESETVLTGITLTREDLGFPSGKGITVAYGMDEELKLQTTAAMRIGSCAFLADNAVRYVDYENPEAVIELIDGKMYAPVSAMALALGLYSEEMPEKGYVLLRKDSTVEFACSYDGAYYQINNSEKVNIDNPLCYKNGIPYLPVRYVAELFGEKVIYKDNIAIIDNSYVVQSIIKDSDLFDYIKNILVGFQPTEEEGHTWYVAQTENASDKNDGSESAPFATLSKAGSVAEAGDTVVVGGGIYRETLTVQNSGKKAAPITFRAKEGETPIISALETVSGFVPNTNTEIPAEAYESVVTADLTHALPQGRNMVFYNGKPLAEGRHPNTNTSPYGAFRDALGLDALWPTRGDLVVRSRTEEEIENKTPIYDIISESDLNQPENYWAGGTFIGLAGSGWSLSTAKITSSQNGSLAIDPAQCGGTWFSNRAEGDDDFGFITNHIHTVDKPEEWYVDAEQKKLYLYPPEGSTAETLEVEIKARRLVIDLEKNSYVNIEGFETIGGGIRMNDGDMNVLHDCTFRYISHYSYTADQRDGYLEDLQGRYKAYDNNTYAPQRGEMGIYIGGEHNVIADCTIDHSAGAAIYSTGAYGLILNNNITDCGYMSSVVGGIFLSGKAWKQKDEKRGGDVIWYNTVDKTGRSAITYENQHDEDTTPMTLCLPLDIGYNDLNNAMIYARDGGIIYTHALSLGSDSKKSKVHHNVIRNVWNNQTWCKSGVYNDNITLMQEVYDNLILSENGIDMSEDVFQQPKNAGNPYWGVVDVWNNSLYTNLKNITLQDIDPSDYPGGKPFRAGSSQISGRYGENFDKRHTYHGWYGCEAVGALSGAAVQNGMVVFSGNDAYVEYKDINFGEVSNVLKLYHSGDIYQTGDSFDIVIGESLESGTRFHVTLKTTSPYLDGNSYTKLGIGAVSGLQNVYIQAKDYKSAAIRKLKPDYEKEEVAVKLYGGEYDDYQQLASTDWVPNPTMTGFDSIHPQETQTRYGATLIYRDVMFPTDCNAVVWSASTSGRDSGSQVKIYIDENPYDTPVVNCEKEDWKTCPDHQYTLTTQAEAYASTTITGDAWGSYRTVWGQTDKTIPKGRHNVYVRFESWHCSDLYYIGFSDSVPEK